MQLKYYRLGIVLVQYMIGNVMLVSLDKKMDNVYLKKK